jgi:hypothetical protein
MPPRNRDRRFKNTIQKHAQSKAAVNTVTEIPSSLSPIGYIGQ